MCGEFHAKILITPLRYTVNARAAPLNHGAETAALYAGDETCPMAKGAADRLSRPEIRMRQPAREEAA